MNADRESLFASEWEDWPIAGPEDWEPCPRCWNMDGGCPFCGHGMVPKEGFQWPK